MAGPRKVRIFRDPKKSPNWYVEWRDAQGRRHCESCGPQRRDAEGRAGQITTELRLRREEAKRLTQIPWPTTAREEAPTSALASDCDGSALQVHGLLSYAQVEVPFTIRLEMPPVLRMTLRRILQEADQ